MKRIYKILILGVLLLLFCVCCGKYIILKHYVSAYVLELSDWDGSRREYDLNEFNNTIHVRMLPKRSVSWNSNEHNKSIYMKYARQNKDLSWNKEVQMYSHAHLKSKNFIFTANYVDDITVIAESDWDDNTPAGSSLDDKFIFISASPDSYIRNGYYIDRNKMDEALNKADPKIRETIAWYLEESLYTMFPVYDTLSKVKFEDYRLLGFVSYWFMLYCTEPIPKGAKINIKISLDNGETVHYRYTTKGTLN